MVISAERPAEVLATNRTIENGTNGASTGLRIFCPRCDARLLTSYHEPECLQCGYANYEYTAISPARSRRGIVSAGTQFVVRYVGEFPSLTETLTYVRLERLRNRVVYGVRCPFCGGEMVQSSLSGKRREVREERYKCSVGHRVSLTPAKDGALGWK